MEALGKYQLDRKLATGGMAEVFLAKAAGPMGFEKKLVVKRILPHLAEDERFIEMFLAEAKLAAALNHPNIAQIFDFGESEGHFFIAMEYVDGPNLRALMRRAAELGTPLSLPVCARLCAYACEGLAYAHDFSDPDTGAPLGLIHRDVSPDNILLSSVGAVKLVDFGIAKVTGQGIHTKTGTLKGKLSYMPPEQLQGKDLDRRTDVYALGVVLYELVTGGKPYEATTEVALMQAILHEPVVPVSQRRPEVPPSLAAVVDRALSKDREERFPDCRAMQAELERFVLESGQPVSPYQLAALLKELNVPGPATTPSGGGSGSSRSGTSSRKSRPGATPARRTPPPEAPQPPPPAVRPWVIPAVIVAALITGAGSVLAWGYLSGRQKVQPAPLVAVARAAREPERSVAQEAPTAPATTLGSAAVPAAQVPREPETEEEVVEEAPPRTDADKRPRRRARPKVVAAVSKAPKVEPTLASFVVESAPRAQVRVNGKVISASPATVSNVPPGDVKVEVFDPKLGFSKEQTFTVAAGDNGVKRVTVGQATIEFRVRPYANVILNGTRQLGQTPFPPVQVYEGTYRVKLVNKDLGKEVEVPFEARPGANTFKYSFTAE